MLLMVSPPFPIMSPHFWAGTDTYSLNKNYINKLERKKWAQVIKRLPGVGLHILGKDNQGLRLVCQSLHDLCLWEGNLLWSYHALGHVLYPRNPWGLHLPPTSRRKKLVWQTDLGNLYFLWIDISWRLCSRKEQYYLVLVEDFDDHFFSMFDAFWSSWYFEWFFICKSSRILEKKTFFEQDVV